MVSVAAIGPSHKSHNASCKYLTMHYFVTEMCTLGIQYELMVWVIMRRQGYPQNAGVLVILVSLKLVVRQFMQICLHVGGWVVGNKNVI